MLNVMSLEKYKLKQWDTTIVPIKWMAKLKKKTNNTIYGATAIPIYCSWAYKMKQPLKKTA